MNIFILDENIDKCAEYHVDKHVVKMPLESAQMLCTTHWINKYVGYRPRKLTSEEWATVREYRQVERRSFPYLPTMHNHPCSVWVRSSLDNYEYLYALALAINDEYGYRYGGRSHKSVHEVILNLPDITFPRIGLTPFAQAMPENLKGTDAIEAYRRYYYTEKTELASWKHREKPKWWLDDRTI